MLLPVSNEVREYLRETMSFAQNIGKQENLLQCLFRLGHGYYNNGKEYVCFLSKDFSEHSFIFTMYDLNSVIITGKNDEISYQICDRSTPWLSGGLIYHGSTKETFTVQLINTDGWSIHT